MFGKVNIDFDEAFNSNTVRKLIRKWMWCVGGCVCACVRCLCKNGMRTVENLFHSSVDLNDMSAI